MSKKYIAISYVDRLKNVAHKPKIDVSIDEHYNITSEQVKDDKTNRIKRKIVQKLDNPEPYKHIKCSDFALENLQASGAIDRILPCSLAHDAHTIVASLEKSAQNIINSSKTE